MIPGPLHVFEGFIDGRRTIVDGPGKTIAEVFEPHEGETARRLTVCWNACDRFETDLLERKGLDGSIGALVLEVAKLKANSESLRALLDEAAGECGANKHLLHRIRAFVNRVPA